MPLHVARSATTGAARRRLCSKAPRVRLALNESVQPWAIVNRMSGLGRSASVRQGLHLLMSLDDSVNVLEEEARPCQDTVERRVHRSALEFPEFTPGYGARAGRSVAASRHLPGFPSALIARSFL